MVRDGLVSSEWIYKNIFGFTEEKLNNDENKFLIINKSRHQIEAEGTIRKSGQSKTPSDLYG